MLTIFSIPKPFKNHLNIIQKNAIRSWAQLKPKCEIILMGDEEGIAETAKELNVRHNPHIEKNEFGTPLLSSAFGAAQVSTENDLLLYANADVIFFQDLIDAVQKIENPLFLMSGRRHDLELKEEIDFKDSDWCMKLRRQMAERGVLHGPSGMDYFIFPRHAVTMPAFAVGRPGWDSWFIYHMRSRKIPVIDATAIITAIHQNHDYSHSRFGGLHRVGGPEQRRNMRIAGGTKNVMSLRDADWTLQKDGLHRPGFPRRFFSILSLFYPWRVLLSVKRWLGNLVCP